MEISIGAVERPKGRSWPIVSKPLLLMNCDSLESIRKLLGDRVLYQLLVEAL